MNVIIFTDTNGAMGFGRYAGPYRIATVLREAGYTCQVIDMFGEFEFDVIMQLINKFVSDDTLWVGFSTTLMSAERNSREMKLDLEAEQNSILQGILHNKQTVDSWRAGVWPFPNKQMRAMTQRIKEINPKTQLVMGGSKAQRLTSFDIMDWYVWGEADLSSVVLTRHIEDPENNPIIYDNFNGGKRVIGDNYHPGPMADKKIKWHESDLIFPEESLPIELSRGCAFKCAYCGFKNLGQKGEDYLKDISVFREEVIENYNRWGTRSYMLSDDTFNDTTAKVQRYAECIQELPFEFTWGGYVRVDTLAASEKMLHALKLTNPHFLNFGIETFSQKAGRAVGKGMDPNRVKDTLYKVKEYLGEKTTISGNFIIGLRYETEDEIWKTVEWLTQPDCPVDLAMFTPMYVLHYRRDVYDSTSDFSNLIGKSPEKYGYEYNPDTGYWKHETMDFTRAESLVMDIQKVYEKKVTTIGQRVAWWGRMLNLGYTLEELRNNKIDISMMDIVNRKLGLLDTYQGKLLGL